MRQRRVDYDVTDSIKTTEAAAVASEGRRIYLDLFQKAEIATLDRSFADITALYAGEHPDCHACDTDYHDIQHVLDVTLAMACLLHGYEREGREHVDARMFSLGVVVGLFHDCGYIRNRRDSRHARGADYTLTHVSRSARYLRRQPPSVASASQGQGFH